MHFNHFMGLNYNLVELIVTIGLHLISHDRARGLVLVKTIKCKLLF